MQEKKMNEDRVTKKSYLLAFSIVLIPIVPIILTKPFIGLICFFAVVSIYILLLWMFGENSIVEMGLLCLIISVLILMIIPAMEKAKQKAKQKHNHGSHQISSLRSEISKPGRYVRKN